MWHIFQPLTSDSNYAKIQQCDIFAQNIFFGIVTFTLLIEKSTDEGCVCDDIILTTRTYNSGMARLMFFLWPEIGILVLQQETPTHVWY